MSGLEKDQSEKDYDFLDTSPRDENNCFNDDNTTDDSESDYNSVESPREYYAFSSTPTYKYDSQDSDIENDSTESNLNSGSEQCDSETDTESINWSYLTAEEMSECDNISIMEYQVAVKSFDEVRKYGFDCRKALYVDIWVKTVINGVSYIAATILTCSWENNQFSYSVHEFYKSGYFQYLVKQTMHYQNIIISTPDSFTQYVYTDVHCDDPFMLSVGYSMGANIKHRSGTTQSNGNHIFTSVTDISELENSSIDNLEYDENIKDILSTLLEDIDLKILKNFQNSMQYTTFVKEKIESNNSAQSDIPVQAISSHVSIGTTAANTISNIYAEESCVEAENVKINILQYIARCNLNTDSESEMLERNTALSTAVLNKTSIETFSIVGNLTPIEFESENILDSTELCNKSFSDKNEISNSLKQQTVPKSDLESKMLDLKITFSQQHYLDNNQYINNFNEPNVIELSEELDVTQSYEDSITSNQIHNIIGSTKNCEIQLQTENCTDNYLTDNDFTEEHLLYSNEKPYDLKSIDELNITPIDIFSIDENQLTPTEFERENSLESTELCNKSDIDEYNFDNKHVPNFKAQNVLVLSKEDITASDDDSIASNQIHNVIGSAKNCEIQLQAETHTDNYSIDNENIEEDFLHSDETPHDSKSIHKLKINPIEVFSIHGNHTPTEFERQNILESTELCNNNFSDEHSFDNDEIPNTLEEQNVLKSEPESFGNIYRMLNNYQVRWIHKYLCRHNDNHKMNDKNFAEDQDETSIHNKNYWEENDIQINNPANNYAYHTETQELDDSDTYSSTNERLGNYIASPSSLSSDYESKMQKCSATRYRTRNTENINSDEETNYQDPSANECMGNYFERPSSSKYRTCNRENIKSDDKSTYQDHLSLTKCMEKCFGKKNFSVNSNDRQRSNCSTKNYRTFNNENIKTNEQINFEYEACSVEKGKRNNNYKNVPSAYYKSSSEHQPPSAVSDKCYLIPGMYHCTTNKDYHQDKALLYTDQDRIETDYKEQNLGVQYAQFSQDRKVPVQYKVTDNCNKHYLPSSSKQHKQSHMKHRNDTGILYDTFQKNEQEEGIQFDYAPPLPIKDYDTNYKNEKQNNTYHNEQGIRFHENNAHHTAWEEYQSNPSYLPPLEQKEYSHNSNSFMLSYPNHYKCPQSDKRTAYKSPQSDKRTAYKSPSAMRRLLYQTRNVPRLSKLVQKKKSKSHAKSKFHSSHALYNSSTFISDSEEYQTDTISNLSEEHLDTECELPGVSVPKKKHQVRQCSGYNKYPGNRAKGKVKRCQDFDNDFVSGTESSTSTLLENVDEVNSTSNKKQLVTSISYHINGIPCLNYDVACSLTPWIRNTDLNIAQSKRSSKITLKSERKKVTEKNKPPLRDNKNIEKRRVCSISCPINNCKKITSDEQLLSHCIKKHIWEHKKFIKEIFYKEESYFKLNTCYMTYGSEKTIRILLYGGRSAKLSTLPGKLLYSVPNAGLKDQYKEYKCYMPIILKVAIMGRDKLINELAYARLRESKEYSEQLVAIWLTSARTAKRLNYTVSLYDKNNVLKHRKNLTVEEIMEDFDLYDNVHNIFVIDRQKFNKIVGSSNGLKIGLTIYE